MESQPVSIWKSSIKYGLFLGLISIFISLIIWVTNLMESVGLLASALIGLVSLVVSFVLLLVFTIRYRNTELGGYISFSEAFQFGLLVILFATILITLYNLIFHTLIDPDYVARTLEAMQQKTLVFMENAGLPESQIEETLTKLDNVPTPLESLRQGIISGLLSGVVLSLITALIVKRNRVSDFEE